MGLVMGRVVGGGVLLALLLVVGMGIAVVAKVGNDPYEEHEAAAKELRACLEELTLRWRASKTAASLQAGAATQREPALLATLQRMQQVANKMRQMGK